MDNGYLPLVRALSSSVRLVEVCTMALHRISTAYVLARVVGLEPDDLWFWRPLFYQLNYTLILEWDSHSLPCELTGHGLLQRTYQTTNDYPWCDGDRSDAYPAGAIDTI